MTSNCGASSHFVDSHLLGDIESWTKDIVKLDPSATIVVVGHRTPSEVSMGTLTVRVTNVQCFIHDMLLPAMNVPGLRRRLFSGGTAALKGMNTAIAKQLYLGVEHFKIALFKDIGCPEIDYVNLELALRGSHQTKVTSSKRFISGQTLPTGSALTSCLLRSGAIEMITPLATVAQPFIATSTTARRLPALRITASVLGAHLISGSATGGLRLSQRLRLLWFPQLRRSCQLLSLHRRSRKLPWRRWRRTSSSSAGGFRTSASCMPGGTMPRPESISPTF